MEKNKDELEYNLSYWMVIALFVLYIIFNAVGIGILTYILCFYDFKSDIMMHTIIASFAGCLMTSSIQYLKKLYKACIYDRVKLNTEKSDLRVLGNFMYFLLRPLFACAFVVIAVFAMKAGIVVIINTSQFEENDRFLYVSVIMAACIGFSVGKVLELFGDFSNKKINKYMERDSDGK